MLGYFLPWLQLKREAGEIKQGKYFENKSLTLNFEGGSKPKVKVHTMERSIVKDSHAALSDK